MPNNRPVKHSAGKEAVSKHLTFLDDDRNDTLLFERLQDYVLEHYPNPERIGCPAPAILRQFVNAPRQVGLAELNDLHILKCAECTRDLMELRRQREDIRLPQQSPPIAISPKAQKQRSWLGIAAALLLCALIGRYVWKRYESDNAASHTIAETIDLSNDGVSRGTDTPTSEFHTLPHKAVMLHLVLPYYSSAGNYDVSVLTSRDPSTVKVHGLARALASGPRTDLTVQLDLHRLHSGEYYLSTQLAGESVPAFYSLRIE
jgi:hypothetical protein